MRGPNQQPAGSQIDWIAFFVMRRADWVDLGLGGRKVGVGDVSSLSSEHRVR